MTRHFLAGVCLSYKRDHIHSHIHSSYFKWATDIFITDQTHSHGLQRNITRIFLILTSPLKFLFSLSLLESVTENPDTFVIEQNISGNSYKNKWS